MFISQSSHVCEQNPALVFKASKLGRLSDILHKPVIPRVRVALQEKSCAGKLVLSRLRLLALLAFGGLTVRHSLEVEANNLLAPAWRALGLAVLYLFGFFFFLVSICGKMADTEATETITKRTHIQTNLKTDESDTK